MADTGALKAPALQGVRVRVPLPLLAWGCRFKTSLSHRAREVREICPAKKSLDRAEEYRKTEALYSDAKNYRLYISKRDNPKLNQQIVDGELRLTLQDLIERGDQLVAR